MLKKFWKQLRSDKIRILMAFVLACLIYLMRSGIFTSTVETKEFSDIPVHLEYAEDNIINLDNKINTASVTFEGSPHRIRKLTANQIAVTVTVDRNNLDKGLIELTEKNIKTPLGIKVKEIHTRKITVNLEILESKKVKIIPVFDSRKKLSENYSVAKTSIFPNEVMISGPKSKIKDIKEVYTSPIPLDNTIQDNFKYTAKIKPIADVATVPSEVSCEIIIARNFSKRVITKVPIQILLQKNTNLDFSMSPAVADVEVSGPSRIIHFLTANDIDVFVNAANITKPGEYVLNVRCASRSNEVKIASVTPIQLTLTAR